jgi:uncharacterized protein (TIGR02271 family)
MAQKPGVHIELRGEEWAVVREGNKRATSTHPTQSEAAETGRDLARRDKSEFFLHAQDGQIREHRDYREVQGSADEGVLDTVSEAVGTVTDVVGGTTGVAAQAAGSTSQETETSADREVGQDNIIADVASGGESSGRGVGEEVRGLTGPGRAEPLGTPEERYAEYGVYDQYGEWIGPLSDLFVDLNDEPEYVGVETGLPGSRSVLIPAEVITVDDRLRRMAVSHPRSLVETAPSLGPEDEVTTEFERRVRVHYGLDAEERAGWGAPYAGAAEPTEARSADPAPDISGHEDDIRVRRSEEEIRVETREREAGEMRVRKRVRTETERLTVPKKRVEVSVERVPVEGDETATAPQIGEEEIVVPVVEEEIVVEKRPVVKEEIRIRKRAVEEVEVVEEDVRREEVEIDDQTSRHTGSNTDPKESTERDDR